METKTATIKRQTDQSKLVLQGHTSSFEIILTEDNPNNIKSIFNLIIKDLKNGLIQFQLNDDKEDMYYHICKEYIKQLNAEMIIIYQELERYDLVVVEGKEDPVTNQTS
ncbi:hypothetical protein [Pedobacter chitinilyticus]|uniref:Uncharacterized protein n=1 Tax=Pedobacter chitinilyticus TaxID=2233776 RepID=A0A3S3PI74_9SPHI|nr:hypothetical protein [Pedobacter chitinilyticus]RWU10065.1 hypothetical protein DPV69_01605 [Pedobacter chitinilyticus]